jgi:site-specific DNA-cytosine methylase
MNVLSLFNGISCGNLALARTGLMPDKIYTSEIDEYTLSIEKYNYPNNIQLDNIQNWCSWNIEKQTISNTQRYKAIGNAWTVDVIAHILKGCV